MFYKVRSFSRYSFWDFCYKCYSLLLLLENLEIQVSWLYIVSCHGIVQLGGLVLGYPWEVHTKVNACKSFLFTEGSLKALKVENKESNLSVFV